MTRVIELNDAIRICPAIATVGHNMSDRYKKISTQQVIEYLGTNGYSITDVQTRKTRKIEDRPFAVHMVRMRRMDMPMVANQGYPELVLFNSHDGTSSLRAMGGFFNFICANGMICGKTNAEARILHRGEDALVQVAQKIPAVMNQSERISEQVKRMAEYYMGNEQIASFAKGVQDIVYKPDENEKFVGTRNLLRPRRPAQAEPSLWNILNVAQENVLIGNYHVNKFDDDGQMKRRKAGKINSITRRLEINQELWSLAETYMDA